MSVAAESAVQEELSCYLNEKGVNHLFVKMVEELLLAKPDQPVAFLVDFLIKSFPEETKEFARVEAAPESSPRNEERNNQNSDQETDSEEEEDEDGFAELAELPKMKAFQPKGTTRRVSVSAGVLKAEQASSGKKVVFAKTEEERVRLRGMLKKSVLCGHLDEEELATVVDAFEKFSVHANAEIIRQGDRVAEHFFIIDRGNAHVYKNDVKLDFVYGPGDSFGEVALMYNAPRAATVKVAPDCENSSLWRLDQVTFKIILMGSATKRREKNIAFLESVPILSEMAPGERMVLADALLEKRYGAGEQIVRQGEPGDEFFIVSSGTVKVERDGRLVSTLGEGKYFGEIALLTSKDRQATVTAESDDVKLLAVHRKVFKRVLGPLSDILSRNMEEYEKWLIQ